MVETPKVSIVLPTYNGARFIGEVIISLLSQTFHNFELIIVDDGSTDETYDIVSNYHDSRIELVRNEKNLGLIQTLNRGIAKARGKYIARMDDNDVSYPQRLEKQITLIESAPKLGVVNCWYENIYQNKAPKLVIIPSTMKIFSR